MGIYLRADYQSDLVKLYNRLIDRDAGNNASDATQIRWTQYDGQELDPRTKAVLSSNNPTLLLRNTAGKHRRTLLAATSPTGTLDATNCVELVDDAGLSIGVGKYLRLYGPAGANYGNLVGDNNGLVTLTGSGTSAGALALTGVQATTYLAVGAAPASAGAIRLSTNTAAMVRNAANSADINLIGLVATDVIQTGQSGTRHNLLGTVVAPGIDPPTVNGQVTAESQASGWIQCTIAAGVLTVNQSYNATASRAGAGAYTITWDRDFAAATYCVVASVVDAATLLIPRFTSTLAGSCTLGVYTTGGVLTDPASFSVAAFGTLS